MSYLPVDIQNIIIGYCNNVPRWSRYWMSHVLYDIQCVGDRVISVLEPCDMNCTVRQKLMIIEQTSIIKNTSVEWTLFYKTMRQIRSKKL